MADAATQYLSLAFNEAIAYFRRKLSMPTAAWDELWGEMHGRAFTVAGALRDDLVADLRAAVDKAVATGTTLAEFRKEFDAIVQQYGWAYKGGRAWRTAVIYDTNLSVAYAAGHYRQRNTPAVLAARPYLRYVPSSSAHPREEHMRWYNLVLPHDDPFWDTHTPPNGWGCKCGVITVSRREIERDGLRVGQAPPEEYYEWTNKKTGEVHRVPVGIDPGWDYNPGKDPWREP